MPHLPSARDHHTPPNVIERICGMLGADMTRNALACEKQPIGRMNELRLTWGDMNYDAANTNHLSEQERFLQAAGVFALNANEFLAPPANLGGLARGMDAAVQQTNVRIFQRNTAETVLRAGPQQRPAAPAKRSNVINLAARKKRVAFDAKKLN